MLDLFKEFDVLNSTLTLWVFKKNIIKTQPQYRGKWVELDTLLIQELKSFIGSEKNRYTETIEYSLLAQNNEASLLNIGVNETEAVNILAKCANETEDLKVTKLTELNNCEFYIVKLVESVSNRVLYCFRKTDSSWKTRSKQGIQTLVFKSHILQIDNAPKFDISKDFDFFILEQQILIRSKMHFESVLSYKVAHIENFAVLTEPPRVSRRPNFLREYPNEKYLLT